MARTIYDIPTPQTPISRAFSPVINNVIISAINPFRGGVPQENTADEPLAISQLGTPVYSDLTFDGGTYTDDAGNTIELDTLNFQTVLMVVEQAKNIVTTQIAGANGTVKEYIGLNDYNITIQGIITGKNQQYPQSEVNSLIEILNAPIAIGLTANFLAQFGIDNAVVTDYSFPQMEGSNSMQPFNIALLSDNSIEAVILQS
jgi:hypothetical protein